MTDKLNKEQSEAYNRIVELFSSPEPQVAILTGSAGTGKTFLTDRLTKALNPALSAMTHKAAAVMNKATKKEVLVLNLPLLLFYRMEKRLCLLMKVQ